MRFMVLVTMAGEAARDYENGRMPTQDEIALMMTYNQELAEAGVMQGGDGLHPTSRAFRVDYGKDNHVVIDGPFVESKELLGGYWIWQVESREEAEAWARKCPLSEGDVLVLRQIFEVEDFGDAMGPEEHAAWAQVNASIEEAKSETGD
ncbi:hypothetical protein BH23CHL5_BH23CHL5_22550 [soil metagenome]